MISRCSHLSDQPLAMKRAARSSSSCGMSRFVALGAEIAGRIDQWLAEVPTPDAVDDDAGGERGGVGEDPFGQFESA